MLNKYEVVREFVNEGYIVPIDVAVELMAEGYDVNDFHRNINGFTVEDFLDIKELYDN